MQSTSVVPTASDPLVQAKMLVPTVRSGSVRRRDLTSRLAAASPALVAVSAPAGYGKTTLMVEWVRQAAAKVAWVSLDHGDDDPTALMSLLATAVQGLRPVDPAVFDDLAAPGVSILGRVVPRLAASLRRSAEPFLLVVDDLHVVSDQECRDALNLLVDHLPPGSTLAATSRNEVWLDLGRRRPRGDLLEIGPSQLAFDDDEAVQLLVGAGVDPGGGLAADLVRRTEGWPAGLYMAALALREGAGSGSTPESFGGDDTFVASYLRTEILDRQPGEVRRFLMRTALLDQLCGSLCDRVLGSSRSAAMLTSLANSNLFLVPLDHHSEWYRYHSLFRDVLRSELAIREPRLVPELHRRAADWYETHGRPEAAIDHARAAGETERAARLITECALSTYASGQLETAERWIADLTDEEVEFYPMLTVLAGLICALTGRPIDASRWADVADRVSNTSDSPDDGQSMDSVRAIFRALMCPHGEAAMAADAKFAVTHEPRWSPWRGSALLVLFSACRLTGDGDQADTVLVEWIETAESTNDTTLAYALTQRARAAMRRSDWEGAAEDLARAGRRITELKRPGLSREPRDLRGLGSTCDAQPRSTTGEGSIGPHHATPPAGYVGSAILSSRAAAGLSQALPRVGGAGGGTDAAR